MRVAGVDIGRVNGIAVIETAPTPTFLWRGEATTDDLYTTTLAVLQKYEVEVLTIERSKQVFARGRARLGMGTRVSIEKAIIDSTPNVGIVRVAAAHAGVKVIYEVEAHESRKILGRISKAPRKPDGKAWDRAKWIDKVIASRLPRLISGWPKGAGDSDHNRDGGVAALYGAARKRLGR